MKAFSELEMKQKHRTRLNQNEVCIFPLLNPVKSDSVLAKPQNPSDLTNAANLNVTGFGGLVCIQIIKSFCLIAG